MAHGGEIDIHPAASATGDWRSEALRAGATAYEERVFRAVGGEGAAACETGTPVLDVNSL
jgi:hypothetical protein